MTDSASFRTFQYVRHHDVEAYEALGWFDTGCLQGSHHGEWSTMMEWRGEGEPKYPNAPSIIDIRADTHGEFSEVSSTAQSLKDAMHASPGWDYLREIQREALEMIATKIARILCGNPDFVDHWVDIAGYAELGRKSK